MNTGRSGIVATDKAVVQVSAPIGDLGLSERAAEALLDYLRDVGAVIGYRVWPETHVEEIRDGDESEGHRIALNTPTGGFLANQKENVEGYGQALAAYYGLEFTANWAEPTSTVYLRPLTRTMAPAAEPGLRERIRYAFLPYVHKACLNMGKTLVAQGFRVREPVAATLITHRSQVNGYAILVKYPRMQVDDKAGITEVYDRILPFMADAHARGLKLRSETLREGDTTLMFFTRSRNFTPSIYETRAVLRPLIVRRPKAGLLPFALFPGATYRACRKLAAFFKKDFTIIKRPMPSIHVKGHAIVLRYKPAADGKLVHDSYLMVVGRAAEKLAAQYHVQTAVRHSAEARMLAVSFHHSATAHWESSKLYL